MFEEEKQITLEDFYGPKLFKLRCLKNKVQASLVQSSHIVLKKYLLFVCF